MTRFRAVALLVGAVTIATLTATACLADNVTATLSGGTLKIKGDADPNTLTLDQPAAGQVRVTGGPTSINGSAGPATFDGVTALDVDLGGGDDTLTLNTLTIPDKVKIKTGPGADTVAITAASFGSTSIDLGGDENALQFCGGTINGSLALKVAASAMVAMPTVTCGTNSASVHGSVLLLDTLDITGGFSLKGSKTTEAVTLHSTTIGDKAKLALGGGGDALAVCGGEIGDALSIQMGSGAGTNAATCGGAASASGENALDIETVRVGTTFTLKAGGNADAVILSGNVIGDNAKLDLGQGANTLTLSDRIGNSLTVKAGKGADVLDITGALIGDNATINAGAGNNVITFSTTTIGNDLTVKTGNDVDVISGTTTTGAQKVTIKHGKGADVVT